MSSMVGDLLRDASPLLTLAVVLLAGVISGNAAQRLRLPAVTGQIIAGILLGRGGLGLLGEGHLTGLVVFTGFALGLIAVTVGAHLNLRRLRNAGRRLSLLLLAEASLTPALVFLAVRYAGGAAAPIAALLAATAIATAPATIVALVKETRSKGVFVKTLVAAVALNNMACIIVFEVVRAVVRELPEAGAGGLAWLGAPLGQILPAVGIGGLTALGMGVAARYAVRPERLTTAAVAALVLCCGLASTLGVSPLLACLFLGFVQTNLTRTRGKLVDALFANFEPAILAIFFTLAGAQLSLEHAGLVGWVALLFIVARMTGKVIASGVAMRLAGAPERVRRNLGIALVPQAGVAVGLVLLIQEDPNFGGIADLFAEVVLSAVALSEIVGPILTRLALRRSGEVGRDRRRLFDFLQEEHIATGFRARTQVEAIEKLVDLMVRTHHQDHIDRGALLRSVMAREAELSTCLGGGLSVPHGLLPPGSPMAGVMALSKAGLDFETPDGRPVHCMVLLGTAEGERDRHLQVLAALARTVGGDAAFQEQLYGARSPAHASEILHGEESDDFNHFLEGDALPAAGTSG